MRNWLLALSIVVIGMGWCHLATAAYLESDFPGGQEVRIMPPPPPPPEPEPENPLCEMVRKLSVRPGYQYGGLMVFLLESSEAAHRMDYLSIEEALRKRVLTVCEKASAEVPVLIVENTGRESILMLGGELLLGGRQNRTLKEDVLLPGRSGPVEVPVLCVEKGRWTAREKGFTSKSSMAAVRVRGAAQGGLPQAEIWEEVEEYQKRLRVKSASGDLQAIQDSAEVRQELARYRKAFAKHCWRPQAVGMVVARHGRIAGADVFCNPALFRTHRDRLLESYAIDCCAYRFTGRCEWPGTKAVEKFLEHVFDADFESRDTPGSGRLLIANTERMSGSALVYRDRVLHASLFPLEQVLIRRAVPRPLPQQRQTDR